MELTLTAKERLKLEAVVSHPEDAKQLKRAQGLLAVADGERPTRIAQRLRVTRASIYEWVKRWRQNLGRPCQRLLDRDRSGRPATVRQALARHVPKLLPQPPAKFGYRYAEWTVELLRAHLSEVHQVAASDGSLRRQRHALGYRWKRPRFVLRRRSPTWRQAKGG